MSIVICKVEPDKIILAGDSRITKGNYISPFLSFRKVTKIGDIGVGNVGLCSEATMLFTYVEQHRPSSSPGLLQRWMAGFLQWRDELSPKTGSTEKDSYSDSAWFLVLDGKAFIVDNMFIEQIEVGGFHALGEGSEFAMGALMHGATTEEAVTIACSLSASCGLPIIRYEFPV